MRKVATFWDIWATFTFYCFHCLQCKTESTSQSFSCDLIMKCTAKVACSFHPWSIGPLKYIMPCFGSVELVQISGKVIFLSQKWSIPNLISSLKLPYSAMYNKISDRSSLPAWWFLSYVWNWTSICSTCAKKSIINRCRKRVSPLRSTGVNCYGHQSLEQAGAHIQSYS